jgi:4-amino-4-deoxy-L-arabinose transferase-like glycosyltransferase
MLNSGDLVTIRFQDELRAKKPAGIYWLQSASAAFFGDEDVAPYRLPSLLAMLLSMYGTYRIARTLYKPQRAVLAAAACGGALVVFAEAHLAKTDSVLMLCCLLQQFALMRIYQGWQNSRRLPYWSYLGVWLPMAAGILIKGPVAPLLALTTIAALSAWHREIRWLRLIRPLRGIVIVAVLTLPWAILVTLATDGAFLDLAVRGDFVAKVQSGQESHGAPLGTYMLLLPLLLWPGSLLLPRAVSQVSLLLTHVESRFLIAWIVPFWLVIELVPTKLPHYPLPVVPALAVLLVCAVDAPLAGKLDGKFSDLLRRYAGVGLEWAMLAAGPVLGMAMIWVALTYGGVTGGRAFAFAMLACAAIAGALLFGIIWHRQGGIRNIAIVIACGALFHFIVIAGLFPALSRIHLARAIDAQLDAMKTPPAAMAAAGIHEPSLVFTLGRDLLLVDGQEAALFLAEAPNGLAIIEQAQNAAFVAMADALQLDVSMVHQLEGFNMSKGSDVRIFLYRAAPFDPNAPKG